ncbi:MAG: hypothetical protein N2483_08800 [Burkholderiaceae bacterium]|nr:hypothetical protein [Burkholderiaceae bacterium]
MAVEPIILVEFNELCPRLIDRWIASGDLPNFASLRKASTVYVTQADELQPPYLEPWIQWYSLHTGVPFQEHRVFRLTEGARRPYPSIWDLLIADGRRVMNFSSMNCRAFRAEGSIFLPDPWNNEQRAFPDELDVFKRFLAKAVQEQGGAVWSARELAGISAFLLSAGIRPATCLAAFKQLALEKLASAPVRWRRVRILDLILLDVFVFLYRRYRPAFATFFSNSTAHLQHAYWRFMEPERFSEPVSEVERREYGEAIKFGYVSMDAQLGRIMRLAREMGARIMFATALSQQPYVDYEGRGGRHYYRPTNVTGLLEGLGIRPQAIQPVMAHQYILTFGSEKERREAESRLWRPTVDGKQLFDVAQGDSPRRLIFGSQIYTRLAPDTKFSLGGGGSQATEAFFAHFYELEATKSGCHHPDGCFWVQTGAFREVKERVSILDVAPTILHHFGISDHGLQGRVLTAS